MEKIDFSKMKVPFTQVANGVLNDPRLSLRAKGLYAYLYSKPEGWDFSSVRIQNDSVDGRDGVRSALNELEKCGYLIRKKLVNGRMLYKVVFPPMEPEPEKPSLDTESQEPAPEKPSDGKAVRRESRPVSNKDIYSNKENDKRASPVEVFDMEEKLKMLYSSEKEHDCIIAAYWDAKKRVFENKKQYQTEYVRELRTAKRMVESVSGYSWEQVCATIEYLSKEYGKKGLEWRLETVEKNLAIVSLK